MPVLISLLGIPGARGAKNAESACCAKVFDDWHLEKFEKILVGGQRLRKEHGDQLILSSENPYFPHNSFTQ